METVRLKIPNMKSAHCQLTVTNSVREIGATVKTVVPSQAEIELTNGITREAVIHVIEKAGYQVAK